MSFFPRSILLATDGSDEAKLATQAATELSKETGSEVHVVYTLPTPAQLIGHHLYSDEVRESLIGGAERDAEKFLKEQAEKIGADGGKIAETHLRSGDPDKEILRTAEALGVGMIVIGSRGLGAIKQGAAGQRLRLGCTPRSLPGVRSARAQDKRLTTCRALKSWCGGPT